MSISLDEVRHVARLARLELDETEILSFQTELNALLGHFLDFESVDLTMIEPGGHLAALQNVWSEDEPWQSMPRAGVLRNAPLSKAGLFVMPQIIED